MPHLIWSPQAQRDLSRLRKFMAPRGAQTSRRALLAIQTGVQLLIDHPEAGRPVEERPGIRDWSIAFGASDYVVRYRIADHDVLIVTIRHMREVDF